jgi:hypothetical protein
VRSIGTGAAGPQADEGLPPRPRTSRTSSWRPRNAGIDPALALAVSQRESNFKATPADSVNKQVNKDGIRLPDASGLFQLTGQTQRQLNVTDPFDPAQNANAGTAYIAKFLNKYSGDTVKALTAFAAGEGYVQKLGVEGTWAYKGPALLPNHQFQGKFVDLTWIPNWLADVTNIANQFRQGGVAIVPDTAIAAQQDTWRNAPPNPSRRRRSWGRRTCRGWPPAAGSSITRPVSRRSSILRIVWNWRTSNMAATKTRMVPAPIRHRCPFCS